MLVASPLVAVAPVFGASQPTGSDETATFVLIHGAWHGGWCWKKLTPLLRAAGHEVIALTLTGLGERSHLLSAEVGLETHVQDVAMVLEYEDVSNVVLVGHSYGGMLLPGVAEAEPERVSHLVYLDAFLPEDGKSLADYAPVSPAREDGWRVPSPAPIQGFGVIDEADVAWAQPRLGDQPLATFTQAARLSGQAHAAFPRTYIQCTTTPWFAEAAGRAKREGFQYHALLAAGHDAMITRPRELAELLLGLV